MDVLRPSLLPGLIHSLRHNVSRKNYDVALFEIGRVFSSQNGATKEERRVAIAITGQRALSFWSGDEREAKFDAYDLKGVLEEFLEQFGLARNDVRAPRGKHGDCFLNRPRFTWQQNRWANSANCCRRWRRNMICATPCCWRN